MPLTIKNMIYLLLFSFKLILFVYNLKRDTSDESELCFHFIYYEANGRKRVWSRPNEESFAKDPLLLLQVKLTVEDVRPAKMTFHNLQQKNSDETHEITPFQLSEDEMVE